MWGELAGGFQAGCAAENNLDMEAASGIITRFEAPDIAPVHCYVKCMVEKMKFMTPDGKMDKAMVVDTVHLFTNELVDSCVIQEENSCRKAYLVSLCVLNGIAED
uniref:Uncharacterized protein n=3 Tax=Photinus pyralis TaxID=7054 RepID=A0A1Y1M7D1_PHOPY